MKNIKIKVTPDLEQKTQKYMNQYNINIKTFYDIAIKRFLNHNSNIKPISIKETDNGIFKSVQITDDLHSQISEYTQKYFDIYKIKISQYLVILQAATDLIESNKSKSLSQDISTLQEKLANIYIYVCPNCGQEICSTDPAQIICGKCNENFILKNRTY